MYKLNKCTDLESFLLFRVGMPRARRVMLPVEVPLHDRLFTVKGEEPTQEFLSSLLDLYELHKQEALQKA